jgi:hypothetical protein
VSLFDLAPVWTCPGCRRPAHTQALCAACEARELDRQEDACVVDMAFRLEVGEDAYWMQINESGRFGEIDDWPPAHHRIEQIVAQAEMAEEGPGRARFHRVGWPTSQAARAAAYRRCSGEGRRRWVETGCGRLAPWRWCWGGMPEELPAVTAGEHFIFLGGPTGDRRWWMEDWVDETDGGLLGELVGCTARPVEDAPVGTCL